MRISKTQRFGLISFFILIVAAYLVTKEPWKKNTGTVHTAIVPETSTMVIAIAWESLATSHSLASSADTILSYSGFELGYNEQYEQAAWVAYVLTREEIESGTHKRKDIFESYINISTGSAAPEKDSIYLITGPILNSIKSFNYKVLVDPSQPDHSIIAFLLPDSASSDSFLGFAIPVDSLEQITGYELFAGVPNQEMVNWIENKPDLDSWN